MKVWQLPRTIHSSDSSPSRKWAILMLATAVTATTMATPSVQANAPTQRLVEAELGLENVIYNEIGGLNFPATEGGFNSEMPFPIQRIIVDFDADFFSGDRFVFAPGHDAYTYTAGTNIRGETGRTISRSSFQENSTFCTQYNASDDSEQLSAYMAFVDKNYSVVSGRGKAFLVIKGSQKDFVELYGDNKVVHRISNNASASRNAGLTDGDIACFHVEPEKGNINISFDAGQSWQNIARGIDQEMRFLVSTRYPTSSVKVSFGPDQSAIFDTPIAIPEGSREGVAAYAFATFDRNNIDPENRVEANPFVVTNTTTHSARDGATLTAPVTENTIITAKLLDVRSPHSIVRLGLVGSDYDPVSNTGSVFSVLDLNKPDLNSINFDVETNRFITRPQRASGILPGDSVMLRITVDNPDTAFPEGRLDISGDAGINWETVQFGIAGEIRVATTLSVEGDSLFLNTSGNQGVDELEQPLAITPVITRGYRPGIVAPLSTVAVSHP